MPRHEHFEELAAVAAKGELTPEEQRELSRHLTDCAECQRAYEDYQELHAPLRPPIDQETETIIESSREKVRAAMLGAIARPQMQPVVQTPSTLRAGAQPAWSILRLAFTSLVGAAALGFMFLLGIHYERHVGTSTRGTANLNPSPTHAITSEQPTVAQVFSIPPRQTQDNRFAQLLSDLRTEKQRATQLDTALAQRDRELTESEAVRDTVLQQLASQSDELRRTQSLLTAKTDELNQMEAAKSKDGTTLVALQYQVQDLSQKLDEQQQNLQRERELLANGRDIRDIIGARNLHIIDVYDTDSGGNTQKSFARAFYTEGKSLIFYAYDLPARRTDGGKFVYAAWGEKNGNRKTVKSLGILMNDDNRQRRWVLNFSDPRVLAEIDSVFVTLERSDLNREEPSGKRMLTAYLDSRANHP